MGNKDYINKIQNISNILVNAKNADEILNNKELDIKEDFQYICLTSSNNNELVNEVIARLAQNGNKDIIENNIKIISMNTWKDLFRKNEAIKSIFVNNLDTIYKNTSIVNYREIELFLQDSEVSEYIYANIEDIISKLSTYDRALLISILNTKENGSNIIKEHLPCFFKRGYFSISTTYARILVELDKTPGIDKLDILRACNTQLSQMLSRETAIDNETNKLLLWLQDALKRTNITEVEKATIKQNIDRAVQENLQQILEKSNYDEQIVETLKQFDCAKNQVENEEESNIVEYHISQITSEQVDENVKIDSKDNKNSAITSGDTEKVLIGLWSNIDSTNKNCTTCESNTQKAELNEEKVSECNETENESIKKENKQPYMSSKDLIDCYIKKYVNSTNNKKKVSIDEQLEKIIVSNVEETNKIIDRVLNKKEKSNSLAKELESTINRDIINSDKRTSTQKVENNIDKVVDISIKQSECSDAIKNENETSLIVSDYGINTVSEKNVFVRIWKKILKIFRIGNSIDNVEED